MSTMPEKCSYVVECVGCNSKLLILCKEPWIGETWFVENEEKQLFLDGWSYTSNDFAICPGCKAASSD